VYCLDKKPGLHVGTIARVRKALRRLRPDVVHTHQITPLFYTGPAAASLGIPLLVHTEHGKVNYRGSTRTRWLGRMAGCFARRFYCLTRDMADAVAAQRIVPQSKLRVIENGIAFDDYLTPVDNTVLRQSLGIPASAFIVGSVGRLHEIKRQDLLIRAFRQIRSMGVDAHLILVGDGPRREETRRVSSRTRARAACAFCGLPTSDAPIHPNDELLRADESIRGMPQSLLEACVAGVPVIASRVGGIPEVIQHERSGLLFDNGTKQRWRLAIVRLLSRPEEARQFALRPGAR